MSPPWDVVAPAGADFERLCAAGNLLPFGDVQCRFAAALSRLLTVDVRFRRYPEMVSLGYWLRPAQVQRMQQAFSARTAGELILPRGLAFHIAPSNVDTIFVYSWMVSMLCGNRNLLRISSRASAPAQQLLQGLAQLFGDDAWSAIAERTMIVRYGHDATLSALCSSRVDVRAVWGGDATVAAFRAFPTPPHAIDLSFGNKFSLAVLDAASVASANPAALDRLAGRFHNDAYWFGQQACSSPRLVVWRGSAASTQAAARAFWPALLAELERRGVAGDAADAMNRRVAADSLAIDGVAVHIAEPDPRLTRVWIEAPAVHDERHPGGGLFHETRIEALAELAPILTRRVQTIGHFGIEAEEWRRFALAEGIGGVDRIVPIGSALEFEPDWDGVNLFSAFTRKVGLR